MRTKIAFLKNACRLFRLYLRHPYRLYNTNQFDGFNHQHTSILGGILTSSIFGPIGIALGLLVAAGLGIVKLFGGGWEKSVAKKSVAAFDENDFNGKFREGINKYWDQTETAFDKAAAKLDEEWNTYVANLRETINSYDINDIQHRIAILRNLSDFFENIPL